MLDAALQAFWRKGYEATTLPDLLEATGLARQSLYNAFGDKRALFLACLRRYDDAQFGKLSESLGHGPVRAAIRRVFESALDGGTLECGCFMVNSAAELLPRDPEVGRLVASAMKRQEKALVGALRRGVREGELSLTPKRIEQTARFLMGTLQGLPVLAKTMRDSAVLRDTVAVALRVID
ncbi:MAG TPA: helix-turn-helix domain-containing protein [Myxococcales bacterium]|nr:helix-turn-helix domain-containing protein [Myxococcales bacterium]